jgi:hypothetical protein
MHAAAPYAKWVQEDVVAGMPPHDVDARPPG